MNPLGRHWQIETLGLVQTDINRLLQTDIGERNGGNQFRKTPIEPIRQTLVKKRHWVRSRQTPSDPFRQIQAGNR